MNIIQQANEDGKKCKLAHIWYFREMYFLNINIKIIKL